MIEILVRTIRIRQEEMLNRYNEVEKLTNQGWEIFDLDFDGEFFIFHMRKTNNQDGNPEYTDYPMEPPKEKKEKETAIAGQR